MRIGFGEAGSVARRHATTLEGLDAVRVVAVADPAERAAAELAADFGARAYAHHEDMLDGEDLDAVYICVPPFAHGPPEFAAIQAGVPFFVEKPLAVDIETAEAVAERLHGRGLVTAVGYHWRYLDTVEEARRIVSTRPPRLVLAYWLDKVPPPGWWVVRDRSGGQVIEQTTHALDLVRYVVGEVAEVYALGARTEREAFPGADVADVTAATLLFEDGAVGSMICTCLLNAKHRAGLDVFGEGMALELSEHELVVDVGDGAAGRPATAQAKTLVDRDFVEAVRGGPNRVRAPYEEALATQRLACALARSADQRRSVGLGRPRAPRRARNGPRTVRSLGVERPGEAAFFSLEEEPPTDGRFLVETMYTGLSAGTELTYFKGTNPYLHAGWDAELGLFRPDRPAETYPVRRMGYMEVGRVVEGGGEVVPTGGLVGMAYGHKTAHTADPARDRFVRLPPTLDPLLGIYAAHMGPICANGLLHAAADAVGVDVRELGDGVRGRQVLVMGAGVVGLLTAMFCVRHGAATVTVGDRSELRLRAARGLGVDVVDLRSTDVWRAVKSRHRHGPGDRGADVAFQCRAKADSLAAALRSLRPQGTVVDLAFYQDGAEGLRLGEEFHHNGLSVRSAQIARVPRGLAPAWTRARLAAETLALMQQHGGAIRRHVITDVLPLERAPWLIGELAERRREVIQAVFEVTPE